jgi:hypothetical protein
MALVGVIVETPALVQVGLPIFSLAEYEINRELNAVSSWSLAFPCSEEIAAQVKSRWRISIIEEGRTGYLLRRGIVSARTFRVAGDGSGVLALQGFSRLWKWNGASTHKGLSYSGTLDIKQVAEDLITGETFTAPSGHTLRKPKIDFTDASRLASLFGAAEYSRYNVREGWGEELDLVDMDDVPDSGYKIMLARAAGTDLASAGSRGIGLIAGAPTIGHDGVSIATRIIPVGTDFDGSQLTLEHATATSPFTVQSALNPDGSTYWYIEDGTAAEVIELHMVRSDVKNPSDNPATRAAAANVLYALAAAKLITSERETLSFASEIANGSEIDALPGSRVQTIFEGKAWTPWRSVTWEDFDRHMLVVKRRDIGYNGIRRVSFTFTCPEESFAIPDLPEAVPIPPPVNAPDPPQMGEDPEADLSGQDNSDPFVEKPPDLPPSQQLADLLQDMMLGRGKLQPCCADVHTGTGGGEHPVPPL